MKKYIQLLVLSLSILTIKGMHAQEKKQQAYTKNNKGKFFISWGGNRANYTKSDIHFTGNNYDFTLHNVVAKDKPKGWHIDYINPLEMTIPQTNFKIGYFISDKYSVSFGIDHMKYVVTQYQGVPITGVINTDTTEPGFQYQGVYQGETQVLTNEFLRLEHTDGLNYIHIAFNRQDDISKWFGIENTDIFQINLNAGIGAGILLPKTNSTLMSKQRYDAFHVSGYGSSIKAGLNLTFLKYFFIETGLKAGHIFMPEIRTTSYSSDKASQEFFFLERVISVGGIFRL